MGGHDQSGGDMRNEKVPREDLKKSVEPERLEKATTHFFNVFGQPPDLYLRVPGRLVLVYIILRKTCLMRNIRICKM